MAGLILKIGIEDTHPPVWRRVVIPENISFYDLHRVIQVIFGWEDAHLHIFETSGDSYEIVSEEADAYGDYMLEEKACVGSVFTYEKWVRYIYDFGDEWRHKITFEKKDESYEKDYAVVLKAKGDNFVEDSGGIWEEEPETSPFDLSQVNEQLESMHFKPVKMPKNYKDMLKGITALRGGMDQFLKHFEKQIEMMAKQAAEMDRISMQDISRMKEAVNQWSDFCEGMELGAVCKRAAHKTSGEILERLSDQEASDYCKYLQLPYGDSCTREQMLKQISEELKQHPVYYLYLLEQQNVESLLRFQKMEDNKKFDMDYDTVMKGMVLGLLHVQIPKGTEAAYLFPAADFDEILTAITDLDWKKELGRIAEFSDRMKKMMYAYGVIEIEAFYELFQEAWNCRMEKRDFLRFVYWYGNFARRIKTYYRSDRDLSYAAIADLDMEKIIPLSDRYAPDGQYRKFTVRELQCMSSDIGGEGKQWQWMADLLHYATGSDEIADDIMTQLFIEVCNGCTVTQLWKDMEKYIPDVSLAVRAAIWQTGLEAVMLTRQPMLHGYTRLEYGKAMGTDPFELGVFERRPADKKISRKTRLKNMPFEVQKEIFDIVYCNQKLEAAKKLERILNKYEADNYELRFITLSYYMDAEKLEKVNSLVSLLENELNDESVERIADKLDDYLMDMMGLPAMYDEDEPCESKETYRREAPKVGRNDPCPCGSGKKYKKCCGK